MTAIVIADQGALPAARSSIAPGSVLALAPGEYRLSGLPGGTADAPVTVTSADPANPATITGMTGSYTHLTVRGVHLRYRWQPGQPDWHRPFQVGGTGIAFEDCSITGDNAASDKPVFDGYPTGAGLFPRGVKGVRIERCIIAGFMRGILLDSCDDVIVRDCDLFGLRSDGINIVACQRVLIEGNRVRDFRASLDPANTDHRDCIQMWTTGSKRPTTDVTIRANLLDGTGAWAQSIFIRNEEVDRGRAGPEMWYRNLRIEDNVILGGHTHGISVGETDGLVIRRNTLLRNRDGIGGGKYGPDHSIWVPKINVSDKCLNVVIEGNLTPALPRVVAGWTVRNNMVALRDVS